MYSEMLSQVRNESAPRGGASACLARDGGAAILVGAGYGAGRRVPSRKIVTAESGSKPERARDPSAFRLPASRPLPPPRVPSSPRARALRAGSHRGRHVGHGLPDVGTPARDARDAARRELPAAGGARARHVQPRERVVRQPRDRAQGRRGVQAAARRHAAQGEIEQLKRLYASQNRPSCTAARGIDYSAPVKSTIGAGVAALPLVAFDNTDFEVRVARGHGSRSGSTRPARSSRCSRARSSSRTKPNEVGAWTPAIVVGYDAEQAKYLVRYADDMAEEAEALAAARGGGRGRGRRRRGGEAGAARRGRRGRRGRRRRGRRARAPPPRRATPRASLRARRPSRRSRACTCASRRRTRSTSSRASPTRTRGGARPRPSCCTRSSSTACRTTT